MCSAGGLPSRSQVEGHRFSAYSRLCLSARTAKDLRSPARRYDHAAFTQPTRLDGSLSGMADFVVVQVKPGSRKGPLVEVGADGELTIYVRERAIDGKANDAVTRLLAAHLQLPKSRVELVSGTTSRLKRFQVGC